MVKVTVAVVDVDEVILAPLKSLVTPDKPKVNNPVPPDAVNTCVPASAKDRPVGKTEMVVVVLLSLELVSVSLFVSLKAAS